MLKTKLPIAAFLVGGLVAGVAGLLLFKKGETDPTLVAAQIQSIGELRTSRMTTTSIETVESSLGAPGAAKWVPFVDDAAKALTRNRAILKADCVIDAGVDLGAAQVSREKDKVVVELPRATIYRPVVDASLEHQSRGLFWKDEGLALQGLAKAKVHARAAAQEFKLQRKAEEEAARLVGSILGSAGLTTAEIRFK